MSEPVKFLRTTITWVPDLESDFSKLTFGITWGPVFVIDEHGNLIEKLPPPAATEADESFTAEAR